MQMITYVGNRADRLSESNGSESRGENDGVAHGEGDESCCVYTGFKRAREVVTVLKQ